MNFMQHVLEFHATHLFCKNGDVTRGKLSLQHDPDTCTLVCAGLNHHPKLPFFNHPNNHPKLPLFYPKLPLFAHNKNHPKRRSKGNRRHLRAGYFLTTLITTKNSLFLTTKNCPFLTTLITTKNYPLFNHINNYPKLPLLTTIITILK